jgi:GTP-binding nuclear protein Ran
MSIWKVAVVGNGGVGKTSYSNYLCKNNQITRKYDTTFGISIIEKQFKTNVGDAIFNFYDTAGQEKFGNLRRSILGAGGHVPDAVIIMFDLSSRITYNNVPSWYQEVKSIAPDALIILVGNKFDVTSGKKITYHKKRNIPYYEMSIYNEVNIYKPLEYILSTLTEIENIKITPEITSISDDDEALSDSRAKKKRRKGKD